MILTHPSLIDMTSLLPKNIDSASSITLIAGQGLYPMLMAENIQKAGFKLNLISFENETSQTLIEKIPSNNHIQVKVGQVGKLLNALKIFESRYALMAGQITPRKLFKGLVPDLKAIFLLAKLKERNAETIFGALADEMLKAGTTLLDARCFMETSLAHAGIMTAHKKLNVDTEDIEHGIYIAKEMARLDVGQSIVVRKGTIIAVEAFEGTDAMLKRAGSFHTDQLIFIKTVKKNQDWRFDVPVVGLKTLETLIETNIKTICLEAQSTIMLNKLEFLEKATKENIVCYGYTV